MKKHWIQTVSLTLVFSLAFLGTTACSSSKTDAPKSPNQVTSATSGSLSVLIWDPEAPEVNTQKIKAFEKKYPNIKVNCTMMTGQTTAENIEPKIAANALPDVFSCDPAEFTYNLADKNLFADVGDVAAWKEMLPSLQKIWTSSKGVKFGISGGLATIFIYYNKDLFDKAGITELPTNWDEFLAVCKKLKSANITPLAWFGGYPNMLSNGPLSLFVGSDILRKDPDLLKKVTTTDYDYGTSDWVNIFTKMKGLADQHYLNNGFMSTDYNTGMQLYENQKAAMIIQGSWVASELLNTKGFTSKIMLPPFNQSGDENVPVVASETGFACANNDNLALSKAFLQSYAYDNFYLYQNYAQNITPFEKTKGTIKISSDVTDLMKTINESKTSIPILVDALPASVHTALLKFSQEIYLGTKKPSDVGATLNAAQKSYISTKGNS